MTRAAVAAPNKSPRLKPLGLKVDERKALVRIPEESLR